MLCHMRMHATRWAVHGRKHDEVPACNSCARAGSVATHHDRLSMRREERGTGSSMHRAGAASWNAHHVQCTFSIRQHQRTRRRRCSANAMSCCRSSTRLAAKRTARVVGVAIEVVTHTWQTATHVVVEDACARRRAGGAQSRPAQPKQGTGPRPRRAGEHSPGRD